MGTKDTKAKEYLSNNERFADLCNAVLFDGAQIIKPENLQERDTAEILSVLGTDAKEILLQKARDLLKQAVVITITVYLGAEPWDGPRKLSDMFRETDGWMEKLVSDYKIHLLVPREIEDFSKFQTSLGAVFEVIKAFIRVNIPINEEGDETDMCKAWEDQKEEGREEGIKTGIETGIELTKLVIRLDAQGHSLSEIAREAKIPEEKVQYILE